MFKDMIRPRGVNFSHMGEITLNIENTKRHTTLYLFIFFGSQCIGNIDPDGAHIYPMDRLSQARQQDIKVS